MSYTEGILHAEFSPECIRWLKGHTLFNSLLNPSLDVGWGLISHHSRLSELHYSSVCLRMCCSWCFLHTKNAFRQFNMHSLVDNWFNWKHANPFLSVFTLVNKLIMNRRLIIHCSMSFHGLCFPKHWDTTIFIQISFKVSVSLAMFVIFCLNDIQLKTLLNRMNIVGICIFIVN